jgi:hypothetical protein
VWNQTEAVGQGVAYGCTPNCATSFSSVKIVLSDVVGGYYTAMTWTIGGMAPSHLAGNDLYLELSIGGRTMAVHSTPTPAPSPTLQAVPTPTAQPGSGNYNNLGQLDQAITNWVVSTKGVGLDTEAICSETTLDRYSCTVFYRPSGAKHVATVAVSPSGSSFTVVAYN